jgi:hypothetical protein
MSTRKTLAPALPGLRPRRKLVFAALYLCEGAPIGFLWWALPTILRERGVAHERIGALTAWLVLPWALKFLWAPLLDLGRGMSLRAWIVGAQLVMALSLLPLLALDPAEGFGWLTASLLVHGVAAASQDAAIDSLAIRTTAEGERGELNGWMQVGMLGGRALFSGGALMARGTIGDRAVVMLLAGGLALSALAIAAFGERCTRRSSRWRSLTSCAAVSPRCCAHARPGSGSSSPPRRARASRRSARSPVRCSSSAIRGRWAAAGTLRSSA